MAGTKLNETEFYNVKLRAKVKVSQGDIKVVMLGKDKSRPALKAVDKDTGISMYKFISFADKQKMITKYGLGRK